MGMKTADRLNGVEAYFFSTINVEIQEIEKRGGKVCNLGIGNPDLSPNVEVVQAIQDSISEDSSFKYQGYKGVKGFQAELKSWYERVYANSLSDEVEVLPCMGAKEAIGFIAMAYLNKGDEVLIPDPGYPAYSSASKLVESNLVFYDLLESNNWEPDLKQLEEKVSSRTKLMWINYPNMPTGTNCSLEKLKAIVKFSKKHNLLLINDNPYSLILNDNPSTIFSIDGAESVCLELNSFSKSFNMAGARIGVIVGRKELLNPVFKVLSNFSSGMFKPLQIGAMHAMRLDESWREELNRIYSVRKVKALEILSLLMCTYSNEQVGMFVWGRLPSGNNDSLAFSLGLLKEKHIFITPGIIFGKNGATYIRISLCSDLAEFDEVIYRLKN
jgi:LL-diaminopimelate aminotransferase